MIQQRTPDSVRENTGNLQYPGRRMIIHLRGRVAQGRWDDLVSFLRSAIPFYEEPGGIRVRLLRDAGAPGDGQAGSGRAFNPHVFTLRSGDLVWLGAGHARTPTAAGFNWSGASGSPRLACGRAMIQPAARPRPRPRPSPDPAAHPFTVPVPASSNWFRHMATASAAPAKAPKMTAGTRSLTPKVVVIRVTISCTALAPMAATSR